MPRIPVYNSRVSAPGPIPGLGSDLAAPGRALTRLGGAIVGFGEGLARKAAAENNAVEAAPQKQEAEKEPDGAKIILASQKLSEPAESGDPEAQEESTRQTQGDVLTVLDRANDDALISLLRADALWQASLDSDPAQLAERALAYFDAAAGRLIQDTGDPARRARRETLARDHRAVLVKRGEQRGNRLMVPVLNRRLATALSGYADAVRRDPAMLAAMLKKGADAVHESAALAGIEADRTQDMTRGWMKQAHVALVEGAIERDPARALASLKSGELDGRLVDDTALIGRLTRQAERARDAAAAREKQAAKAQRGLFDLRKAEHLDSIRRTGRGDPEVLALAGGLLDAREMTALRGEVEDAEAHNAARNQYAFTTAKEIEKDIKRPAPRYADGGRHGKAIRKTAREEVLAERRKDPAGWAMRDETVAEAFAAAEEATAAAESPESGLAEAEQADRAFQRALALRTQVQHDMGETPRLLTEAEREALAAELQSLAPAERLARIGELRRRYGDQFEALAQELTGRIAPDTAVLLARADDPALAGALARGMGMDGVEFRGPRVLTLPVVGGKLDTSRLDDGQLYQFMVGGRMVRVVYDRNADALVPVLPTRPDDDGAMQNDEPSAVERFKDKAGKAFLPAAYPEDAAIEKFQENSGYELVPAEGGFTLTDPSGHETFALSEEEAAVLAHIWMPEIARRAEAMGALWRGDLSSDEKRRRIVDEVYRNIPEALRDVSIAEPSWISMEGGDPDDFGQRMAAERLKAFDALAAALESGATEQEIAELVDDFHEVMLPEVFGLGRIIKEFFMDVAPGLGNIRSIRHLQNDIAEIRRAVETGEWGDAAIASGMAILDAIGIFPGVNTVKGVASGVARRIPYANRLFAERSVRRLMRQWSKTGGKSASIDAKTLVGDLLHEFDQKIQESFIGLVRNRVGIVGQNKTYADVIKRMDPKADEQVRVDLKDNKRFAIKTRIYDAEAQFWSENLEIENATLGRLGRWLAGAGEEVVPGTKGARKKIEHKTTDKAEIEKHKVDKYLEDNPKTANEEYSVDGIVYLRKTHSELPMDFLVQDISGYLNTWAAKGRIPKDVSDKLQLAMRQLKAKGIETVRIEDYVGFLARLDAALLRDGGETMRVPVGMS